MRTRPRLTTTTTAETLAEIAKIEASEKRTRASVVDELLAAGLRARRRKAK